MPLSSAFSVSIIAALLLPRDAWCSVHVTHPKDAQLLDWLPGGPQARVHSLPPRIPVTYESNPAHFQYTLYNSMSPTLVSLLASVSGAPVKFSSKLNYFIFGFFDPTNNFFDNKNK